MNQQLAETLLSLPPLKALFFFKHIKDTTNTCCGPIEVRTLVKQSNPDFFNHLIKFKDDNGYGDGHSAEFNYALAKQQPEWDEMSKLLDSILTNYV